MIGHEERRVAELLGPLREATPRPAVGFARRDDPEAHGPGHLRFTFAITARVASAALWAASNDPSACSASEKFSTPIGALLPASARHSETRSKAPSPVRHRSCNLAVRRSGPGSAGPSSN